MAGDLLKDAAPPQATRSGGWTTGRIVALATGSVLALISLVLIAGCATLTWADQAGYLTMSTSSYSTGGYALASDPVNLHGTWGWLGRFADKIQIRVTSAGSARPLFAGIATAGAAGRYLAGVGYTTVGAFGDHDVIDHPGAAPVAPPATALHWAARAEGTGSLTLTWTVTDGDWLVVVMNPDGSKGVTIRADVGMSSPALPALASELLVAGVLLGLAAAVLILVPVRLAARPRQGSWPG